MSIVLISTSIVSAACMVIAIGWLWRIRAREQRRTDARVAALSAALDGQQIEELPAEEHPRPANGAVPIRAAVAIALTLALIVAVATTTRDVSQTPATPSLQLMAMDHVRSGDGLTISGLVRNAKAERDLDHVTAVVSAFDRDGNLVASAVSGLDAAALGSGAASRFLVALPRADEISRYRVTFRTEHGTIRHADRRPDRIRLVAGSLESRSHR